MEMGVPVSPAFVLAERGREVAGEKEKGTGAAKNAARYNIIGAAGPARGEAHAHKKKEAVKRQGGKRAWRCCGELPMASYGTGT